MQKYNISDVYEKIIRVCPNCGSDKFKLVLTEGEFKIVKCVNCSLIYLQNIPNEKDIYENYYEIEYKKYDYTRISKYNYLVDIYCINNQRMYYIKQFKLKGNLLDVGCGTGLFMKTALEYGYNVYGIDVSIKALTFAKDEFKLSAHAKTLDDLIDEGRKFDVITLWHVAEHFRNPVEQLKKIRQLLNDDGICYIEVPNFNSIKFKLSKNKWKGGNHPLYHRTFFTNKTLKNTLRESGFSRIKRLKISYELPNKSGVYNKLKDIFNLISMDAFLDYVVWK